MKDNEDNKKPRRFLWQVLINLGIMAVAACVIVWLALLWLDSWTDHGHYEVIPDVKGSSYSTAVIKLRTEGFKAEISDSIYDSKAQRGTVIEQNPKPGTKVKEGRTVYLTIVALSPKTVTIPALTDLSLRQVKSILEGVGITRISEKRVPSEYRDLVMAVTYNGVRLSPGARIPVTASVVVEVGDGLPEMSEDADSEGMAESIELEQLDLE